MNIEPKILKAKCKRIVEDNSDILKMIVDEESAKIFSSKLGAESEFELTKNYFFNEGIKEGMRKFVQLLNEYASKDV